MSWPPSSTPRGGPMVDVAGYPGPLSDCVIGSSIGKNGYARVPGGKRGLRLYGHRIAWEAIHGPIPAGHHIHHRCGTKACVNVEHLELLTPKKHYALNRRCEHGERYWKPDGHHSRCRSCENEKARLRERERYHADPVYRAKKIARAVAAKRRKREEVGSGLE